MPKRRQNDAKTTPKRRQNATKPPPPSHFRCFLWGNTQSARGGNRTAYRPVPTRPQAAGPTTMLIPPRSPAFSAASYAQEIQALGEQCASIVVRPEKHDFLKFSTPNILKRNFFVVFRGKTHSARGGNRTGYRPDPPASRGPNHYANPALLSGFLCTGNTSPGRAVRVNCRPSRKTLLFKVINA